MQKVTTEWYDFPNVKSTKMLSFLSVVEAYGLIYPRPLGENSCFACLVGGEGSRFGALARPHWSPSRHRPDNRGPQCFLLGKRDWARSHNQVVIVHCLVELFCILHPHILADI